MDLLAVRAARLFDGESDLLTEDPVVVIDGHRVHAVLQGEPPEGAEVVDLGDATLLPGLVDAHMHLAFDAGPDPVASLAARDDAQALDAMRAAARAALDAGITTVRDLGDRGFLSLPLRDELARDPAAGPELLVAGPPITLPQGHCWYLGGEAKGVDALRAAVRERAERGTDVVKVMASGGFLTPGTRTHEAQYSRAELRAVVDEAHRAGLPVAAHAHAAEAIAFAVDAGVDSIEHCSFVGEHGIEPRAEVIEAIVRTRTPVSVTFGTLPGAQPPPAVAALLPSIVALVGRLRDAGAELVFSTDAGIGPPKPHGVLPHTIGATARLFGMPPAEALRSITSRAAALCRVGDRKGRIAPGYDADLLAVAGDLLGDPAALLDRRAVFRAGRRVR
ncbi:amidohydrolase family protein [Streptomyces sp. NPDC051940]|uniref:amidohydrolase family protein n=1 Tax=Streptomyces sp. NPDC051940 TaxID=3155675 RepID=UPI00343AAC62